jgi:hypothetical protein
MSAKVRLPLVELSEQSRTAVTAVMAQFHDVYSDYMIGSFHASEVGVREAAFAG